MKEDINVDDLVFLMDSGMIYPDYYSWFQRHLTDYLSFKNRWESGGNPYWISSTNKIKCVMRVFATANDYRVAIGLDYPNSRLYIVDKAGLIKLEVME
jgi:hypothetical protein